MVATRLAGCVQHGNEEHIWSTGGRKEEQSPIRLFPDFDKQLVCSLIESIALV